MMPMTREELVKKLEMMQDDKKLDPEQVHCRADGLLCKFLENLGYLDIVKVYDAIEPKWYA